MHDREAFDNGLPAGAVRVGLPRSLIHRAAPWLFRTGTVVILVAGGWAYFRSPGGLCAGAATTLCVALAEAILLFVKTGFDARQDEADLLFLRDYQEHMWPSTSHPTQSKRD